LIVAIVVSDKSARVLFDIASPDYQVFHWGRLLLMFKLSKHFCLAQFNLLMRYTD